MWARVPSYLRSDVRYYKDIKRVEGGAFDIHKAIGKLPKPKKGWVVLFQDLITLVLIIHLKNKLSGTKKKLGTFERYQSPTGNPNAVAMQHDIDYSVCQERLPKDNVKSVKMKQIENGKIFRSNSKEKIDNGGTQWQEM